MKTRRFTLIIICLAAAAAILIPALTLFNWGDYLWCSFDAPANKRMIIEVIILAVTIGIISLTVKKRKHRMIALTAVSVLFAYIHSMLLPLMLAGIYFIAVISMGGLVTGVSAVIIIEGLLSLTGLGRPEILGTVVIVCSILCTVYKMRHEKYICFRLRGESEPWQLIINAVVLLVVLVQIGRASVAVRDFDSLWYGLRSEHVLAPGGSIFENLGLVGMVYTYSKGFEILTLPLSPWDSYAYIPVFNTLLFIVGLFTVWNIVKVLCENKNQKNSRHNSVTDQWAGIAVIITSVIPGIVNMCVAAKPDMITWVLQLIMIEQFFKFVITDKKYEAGTQLHKADHTAGTRLIIFLKILAAYLLSLTMKPTAVIFSTALAGMMLIWWIIDILCLRSIKSVRAEGINDEAAINAEAGKKSEASVNSETEKKSGAEINYGNTNMCCTKKSAAENTAGALAAFAALGIVWARTVILAGVPFTSVFTGIFTAIGFELKYPFSSTDVPKRFDGIEAVIMTGKRIARMLFSPEGEDMSHVSITWCGSIMFVLAVIIIICIIRLIALNCRNRKPASENLQAKDRNNVSDAAVADASRNPGDAGSSQVFKDGYGNGREVKVSPVSSMYAAAAMLFIPFAIVCAVSLSRLSQVDGNYYMLLYAIVTITAMWLCAECSKYNNALTRDVRTLSSSECRLEKTVYAGLLTVMVSFQFFIMLLTNWASAAGFTPIAFNRLYYDNEADNRTAMTAQADPSAAAAGNTIYDHLAAEPSARVMAMAEHPSCLQFKCVVQSYNDIAAWGNPELVDSVDAFEDYLHFAGVDYIYADTGYLESGSASWQAEIMKELEARGVIYDFMYEGGCYLVRVR